MPENQRSLLSLNTKQASSVTGLTVNLPKSARSEQVQRHRLIRFILTSKAVETGLIEDNILTRAHEIAADSVIFKITSLVMENLAIVHHMLDIRVYARLRRRSLSRLWEVCSNSHQKTLIVGNVGAGAASRHS